MRDLEKLNLLKKELEYNKTIKKYVDRWNEMNAISLDAFINKKELSPEFKAEWKRINNKINREGWSRMWVSTGCIDRYIADLENDIKKIEQGE